MTRENINNLTSFWETGAAPFAGYQQSEKFNVAKVANSGWPNKIWQPSDFDFSKVDIMISEMQSSPIPLTMAVWQPIAPDEEFMLNNRELTLKFRQVGMSLPLSNKLESKKELTAIHVKDEKTAAVWSDIYPEAFNYEFPKHVLINSLNIFEYYLFMFGEHPVGTGILFTDEGVSGIHGIGVPPLARRRGYAEEITKFLVNKSIERDSKYAVLQASDMGYSIYKRLGFREDFRISNYILK